MPNLKHTAAALRKHGSSIELPPKTWLEKTFPDEIWQMTSNDRYLNDFIIAHTGVYPGSSNQHFE